MAESSVTSWQLLQGDDATRKCMCGLLTRYTFACLSAAAYTQGGGAFCFGPWTLCCFLLLHFVLGNICCVWVVCAALVCCTPPLQTSQDLPLPVPAVGKLVCQAVRCLS